MTTKIRKITDATKSTAAKSVAKIKQFTEKVYKTVESKLPEGKLLNGTSKYNYVGKKENVKFKDFYDESRVEKSGLTVEYLRFSYEYRPEYSYTLGHFEMYFSHRFGVFMIYSRKRNKTFAWVKDTGTLGITLSLIKSFGLKFIEDEVGTMYNFNGLINHDDFLKFLGEKGENKRLYWLKENEVRSRVTCKA